MNSEKENPVVEIRTKEDAAKWVGRNVRMGWRGGRDLVDHWYDYKSGVLTHTTVRSGADLRVHLDSGEWLPYTCGDPIIIRLLDGAAHPRPEGDGWVWCETSEQVTSQFAGKAVDFDAAPFADAGRRSWDSGSATVGGGGCNVKMIGAPGAPAASDVVLDITLRGGTWIRPVISEPAKSPEREAADSLEIETVAADDAAQAASAYAASLHRELRNARREAEEADERESRTKADALWVLPDGWTWVRYNGKPAASADKSLGYFGSSVLVSGDSDLDLNITVSDDIDNWVPFTVAEVVIARHRAENPE